MCWKSGGKAAKSLCAFWPCGSMQCGFSGIVCGLLVDFRWPVNTWLRMGVLEAQDVAAVGVTWPKLPYSAKFSRVKILANLVGQNKAVKS